MLLTCRRSSTICPCPGGRKAIVRFRASFAHRGGDFLTKGAIMESKIEIWKPIVGFEGYYEVGSFGNVRSVTRTVPDSRNGSRTCQGKALKPNVTHGGYSYVMLYRSHKGFCKTVHRLVAKAFIPNPENLNEVDHISGVKSDNSAENLQWVSMAENRKRAWDSGLYSCKSGVRHTSAKLSESDVISIRSLSATKSTKELALQFGVSGCTIQSVKTNKRWVSVV
jgi:hypothetical protein